MGWTWKLNHKNYKIDNGRIVRDFNKICKFIAWNWFISVWLHLCKLVEWIQYCYEKKKIIKEEKIKGHTNIKKGKQS